MSNLIRFVVIGVAYVALLIAGVAALNAVWNRWGPEPINTGAKWLLIASVPWVVYVVWNL